MIHWDFILPFLALTSPLFITGAFANKQYGCEFVGDKYFTRKPMDGTLEFGDKFKIKKFKQEEEYQLCLDYLGEYMKSAVDAFVLNNVKSLISMYKEFNEWNSTSEEHYFLSFKNKANPEIIYDYPIGSVLYVLQTLPSHKAYFIAVQTNANPETFDQLKSKNPNINTFYPNHVAGLMRINVKGKLGYVLLDPGSGIVEPVVLMDDLHWKGNSAVDIIVSNDKLFEFTILNRSKPYIQARIFNFVDMSVTYNLYYVGKAFCNFFDFTIIYDMFNPKKHIIKRDRRGVTVAALNFTREDPEKDMKIEAFHYENEQKIPLEFPISVFLPENRRYRENNVYPGLLKLEKIFDFDEKNPNFPVVLDKTFKEIKNIHEDYYFLTGIICPDGQIVLPQYSYWKEYCGHF